MRTTCLIASAMLLSLFGLLSPTSPAVAKTLAADWEMNEAPGASVMVDSTSNHHNGVIGSAAAAEGLTLGGGTYKWSLRCPTCAPTAPARVVQVADRSDLEVPNATVPYTLEVRFKTTKGYGNMVQKGQGGAAGGQIKIENPNGFTQCVFDGAGSGPYVAVASPVRLNDGVWHKFGCVHTATAVETWVDGTRVAMKKVATGWIDNSWPFVVGGKSKCDQVKVTCDYFSGSMDWVRVSHG